MTRETDPRHVDELVADVELELTSVEPCTQTDGRAALAELARRARMYGIADYEYVMERSAILATGVGIARLRLQQGDAAAAEEELDQAAARTDRLLREYLAARGATQEQIDLLLGHHARGI